MNTRFNDALLSVEKAREALRNGNRTEARQWAEHAASLAPEMEDPWLILAAVASPRASVEYVERALRINPNSERARRGMDWARQRLQALPSQRSNPPPESIPNEAATAKGIKRGGKSTSNRNQLLAILLFGLGCMICAAVGWFAYSSPTLASLMNMSLNNSTGSEAHPQVWAQVEIRKPTYTPSSLAESLATPTPQLLLQPTSGPTQTPVPLPTETPIMLQAPTETPIPPQNTDLPTTTSLPTQQNTEVALIPTPANSGSISMSIIPDTPTPENSANPGPTNAPLTAPGSTSIPQTQPPLASKGTRWIDVNLTQQKVYAYQGDSVVNSFTVSTGTWQSPTVTGQYHIYVKLLYTDMTGPGYYLPNVPYTMYFYQGYGLHGTYWHHNFGTPMSHGCVNLSIPDAEWLYNWASVGTLVNVHY
jgi:lipoprotein-anchoring transpeptidase ErfK/SrfK